MPPKETESVAEGPVIITNAEFDSKVKEFKESDDKSLTNNALIKFVTSNYSTLGLPPKFNVKKVLFDYFNRIFLDLAGNKNSNPDEVIRLRDCASAFADYTSLYSLKDRLKKYFFLFLDDLVVSKCEEKLFADKLSLAKKSFEEEEIFDNKVTYLRQRKLNYYYQAYYDEPSDSNLTQLENFFNDYKDNSTLYQSVSSAKFLFQKHLENILIRGILDNNYDYTPYVLKILNDIGAPVTSYKVFMELLKVHLEPIISASGSFFLVADVGDFSDSARLIEILTGEKYEKPANIKTYLFPDLKLSDVEGMKIIKNFYESDPKLPPQLRTLGNILKLFFSDFKKLKTIPSNIHAPLSEFNDALSSLHSRCFSFSRRILTSHAELLLDPPQVLRKPFFKTLGLDESLKGKRILNFKIWQRDTSRG